MIKYVQGDLFDYVEPMVLIPHVCNRDNKWGRGFVVPLMNRFPLARSSAGAWYRGEIEDAPAHALGNTQVVEVEPQIYVANMVAQLYYTTSDYRSRRPLYYNALVSCMEDVRLVSVELGARILAPKFGSELAGGDWKFVECLIYDIWEDLDVTVVEYK